MKDPYKTGMFRENPYAKKKPLIGQLVVVLDGKYEERGLKLISQPSRCLLANEVHELIITDEESKQPGDIVNKIAYLGFFVVKNSGVILAGDKISINDSFIGTIAGFDETHMPNHYNIIIYSRNRISGKNFGLELDNIVKIG